MKWLVLHLEVYLTIMLIMVDMEQDMEQVEVRTDMLEQARLVSV